MALVGGKIQIRTIYHLHISALAEMTAADIVKNENE